MCSSVSKKKNHLEFLCSHKGKLFSLGSWWGKVMILDQLKKRRRHLAYKCFFCYEDEEIIEHILVRCSLYFLLFLAFLGSPLFS